LNNPGPIAQAPIRRTRPARPAWKKTLIIFAVLLGGILVAAFTALEILGAAFSLRAFRIPSNSMCPAICEDERLFASMDAYEKKPPVRGDVVLIRTRNGPALFVKRIIALEGDVVSQLDGKILVNGKPAEFPVDQVVCGAPVLGAQSEDYFPPFPNTTVEKDSYFVVGDNLPNSFDSRFAEFGRVRKGDVQGKPLLLYWSPGKSRIGCRIK
jgi:signal peptidase I